MAEQYDVAIKAELKRLLDSFNQEEPYVKAIVAVSASGLPICSVILDDSLPETKLTILVESAFHSAGRVNLEINHGDPKLVFIQGEKGDFLLVECGTGTLGIVFDKPVYLAQLFLHDLQRVEETCTKLAPIFLGRD
ncbi:MAG: roadblock/LC7 domain-containing protein [Candidatus Helarchaeota archaeon]|nr:roadblock/LC7 domain-containing protein [Candidatus Helarchaeota archaeon]